MITSKTPAQIICMQEGGVRLGGIRDALLKQALPGVSLLSLEKLAEKLIRQAGGEASFKTVKGYEWATCLCVNEAVVHGIPTEYLLTDGDILTIDVGMLYKGLHTDTAWTMEIGHPKHSASALGQCAQKQLFLKTGQEALDNALATAKTGNRIGHISQAIQNTIEPAGYSVVRSLVGHGVGKELHEEPQIPGILKNARESTELLAEGMTLAIEVIYAQGSGSIVYENDDGWTLSSRDGSLTAVFEHTIVVTGEKPIILTKSAS